MSADNVVIGARLRTAREAEPYWSREVLARLLRDVADERTRRELPSIKNLAHMIKEWERGLHGISGRYRALYARVLEVDEAELFEPTAEPGLWRPPGLNGDLTPDDEERLTLAAAAPARIDLTVVDSLATILAMQRRLDDTLGPAAILPSTAAQTDSVTTLIREARGPARDALGPVAGEWVQFHGWLHAELRNDRTAVHLLTDAEDLADEIGDGPLAAQAANFKGYLARQQGRPRGVVRHFLTAFHTPGAHPAQRLGDAVQAAQGYGLLGEDAAARRLLLEAEALEDEAARELPPDTAYWLTPDFQHINVGLALAALGEHKVAAEHLAYGLASLPPDQRDAEWTKEYRDALDRAHELS